MEDCVVLWKVSGLLHWVSGFRQSVWGFEVRCSFTFRSLKDYQDRVPGFLIELGVFLMAFWPTRTPRSSSWILEGLSGFYGCLICTLFKGRFFGVLEPDVFLMASYNI